MIQMMIEAKLQRYACWDVDYEEAHLKLGRSFAALELKNQEQIPLNEASLNEL